VNSRDSVAVACALALSLLSACGGGSDSANDPAHPEAEAESSSEHPVLEHAQAVSSNTVVVRARGTLLANTGPIIQLRVNGQTMATLEIKSTTFQDYSIATGPIAAGALVEVVYTNDASASGQDRNLYVESVVINSRIIPIGPTTATYDRGSGAAASDNLNVIAGQSAMLWNGSLRVMAPAEETVSTDSVAAPASSWTRTSSAQSIATFDGGTADSISNWVYGDTGVPLSYKGSALAVTGMQSSWAGSLKFDLGCGTASIKALINMSCGNAASMAKVLPTALSTTATSAISFNIRNPGAGVFAEMTVTDSTGQVLSYRFDPRTIETPKGTDWSLVEIPLTKTPYFFRGANDGVVHGPITRVTIGAGTSSLLVPADQMQIDNIQLLADSNFSYRLDAAAALVPGSYKPSYAGRLAVAAHNLNLASFDKAKEAGITVIRRDLTWSAIEQHGSMVFGEFDKWTTALNDRGMSMVWILDYGHPDHGGGAPVAAADRTAFATYAAAAADHYKGKNVIAYEVWNEPNYATFWAQPDAVAYGTLLGQTADAIKARDASAKVLSGGVAFDGIRTLTYLTQLAQTGALKKVDGVTVHPYRASKPETFAADRAPITNMLAANGVTAPLSVSEWGYGSYGYIDASIYGSGNDPRALNRQAVLTLRQVLTQLTMDLPLLTVYDLVDDCVNPTHRECNFGLLLPTLADKPAMTALRTLYSVAQTRAFKGPLSGLPPVMHAVRWDGSTDKVFALWVDTPGASVKVTLPSGVTAVRLWNGAAAAVSASTVTLGEGDGPVFVTVAN